ncbi:SDR family NAD(P)-dependent oxidoreductase [Streptomyces shenzhenensis]|uniref:SDR family NAD(P)-dependent oxidoreductase n=1 Tax=Streptomyces shenzhenensis TaxID=943815 RepID=UPI0033E0C44C
MSSSTPPHFMDRVAIVTGAGSGIGRATALALAGAGAHVLGVGRRQEALEETARAHRNIAILPLDICREGAAEIVVADALERWGRLDVLVNNALPGGAHYAATKAALEQLTRSWALELAAEGVRVNAIAPGPTTTDVLAAAGLSQEAVDGMFDYERDRIPTGRLGAPEDVAGWIVRIADPLGQHITGQVLTVDGGLELV